jgi:SAM-dependent methyltransferase
MNTVPIRHPYQGVLQIMQFNWRSYAAAAVLGTAAMLIAPRLTLLARAAVLLCAAPAVYWLIASLLVSHYVYDRFPLYDLNWIPRVLDRTPARWINIHSGLDETSALLEEIFPQADHEVADIFDPRVMTEASIHRARQLSLGARPAQPARYDALPFRDGSFDAAFSIFAAHELRSHRQRVALFSEVARILAPGGQFIVVEHARDWSNFLAFGPAFLHFFSPRAWRRAACDADFTVQREFHRTAFVRVYILRRILRRAI